VRWEALVNWPFSSTLAGVDTARSSPLGPPWPDLVITAGRRNEPIARWIRRSADRRVRLVRGTPVGAPVALGPGRHHTAVPGARRAERPPERGAVAPRHARAARQGSCQLAAALRPLPRPLIAVLAGGNSGPYPFDARSGWRLGRRASALARDLGGSLLVTTSARTLPHTVEALVAAIDVPHHLYRWAPDDAENPYFGFLAAADHIIVTADSVSMMAEACATGRPVLLYDTGEGVTSMRDEGQRGASRLEPARPQPAQGLRLPTDHAARSAPLTRDIRIVQRRLVESGRAELARRRAARGAAAARCAISSAPSRARARALLSGSRKRRSPSW
jgi:hypothetical protein